MPILDHRIIERVPPFGIAHIDVRPRRGYENCAVIAMRLRDSHRRLTSQAFESCGGIKHAPVKEYPTSFAACSSAVGKGHLDSTTRKSDLVDPGQRGACTEHFFLDDPPARLLDGRITALGKFGQKRGLAPSGA